MAIPAANKATRVLLTGPSESSGSGSNLLSSEADRLNALSRMNGSSGLSYAMLRPPFGLRQSSASARVPRARPPGWTRHGLRLAELQVPRTSRCINFAVRFERCLIDQLEKDHDCSFYFVRQRRRSFTLQPRQTTHNW